MAFVTKYKLKRTLGEIEGDFAKDPIFKYLSSKYYYLSDREVAHLTIYFNFTNDPTKFIEQGHLKWADTKRNAVEVSPAYHSKNDCEGLLMRFDNVMLPQKIQTNDGLLNEAREIARQVGLYKFGEKSQEELLNFVNICIEEMNNKHKELQLIPTDFKIIHDKKNSGNTIYENNTLNDIKVFLDKLLEEIKLYFGFDENRRLVIPDSFFANPNEFPIKLLQHNRVQVLEKYRNTINIISYKKSVKNNYTDFCSNDEIIQISEEIKTKFSDPTISTIEQEILKEADIKEYNKTVLEILGFKPCKNCGGSNDITRDERLYIEKYKII